MILRCRTSRRGVKTRGSEFLRNQKEVPGLVPPWDQMGRYGSCASETVLLGEEPSFWKLIERRRKQPTVSLRKVKAALGVDTRRTRRRKRRRSAR